MTTPDYKQLLETTLLREVTNEEVEQYIGLIEEYNSKILKAYNDFKNEAYCGYAMADMVWAKVNYKGEVLAVGAEEKIYQDTDLLYPGIAAAINEAAKVSLKAYDDFKAENTKLIQDMAVKFNEMFPLSENEIKIDSKLLN